MGVGWSVVDLFCGAGGLSHGFRRAGFNIAAGVDADPTCGHAFEHNNQGVFVVRQIEHMPAEEIDALYPKGKSRVLIGCAPCAPFSAYTPKHKQLRSGKWSLLSVFADRIRQLQPEIVSMENVPRLASFDGGRVLQSFVEILAPDYHISIRKVDCREYGVPQRRVRLVLLASRLGPLNLKRPIIRENRTVRDAIGHLPPIEHGKTHPSDPMHRACALSPLNLERIRASYPGGSWKDWPIDLRTRCHRRPTGRSYTNVYGRMAWNQAAPTITTGCLTFGRGRFGHPEQDRAISLREAALLQTFPPDYSFVAANNTVNVAQVARHIGNAVPVALGEAIAQSITCHIEEN